MTTKNLLSLFLLGLAATTAMTDAASDAAQTIPTETTINTAETNQPEVSEKKTEEKSSPVLPSGMTKATSPRWKEFSAWFVDTVFIFTSALFVAFPLAFIFTETSEISEEKKKPGYLIGSFFFVWIAELIALQKVGWPGSHLMGIRIVNKNGEEIGYFRTFLRGLHKCCTLLGPIALWKGGIPWYQSVPNTSTVNR